MKNRIRRFFLRSLERLLELLTRPFVRAGSMQAYATKGFIALGIILAIVTAIVWVTGNLDYPLSRTHPLLRDGYRFIIDKTPFSFIPDSYISLLFLPFIVYIGLALWPSKRMLVGEKFANLLFAILNSAISLGEWCIENRWGSLSLIMLMVAILSLGINKVIRDASRSRALQQSFNHWLIEAEDLIEHSAYTNQEVERYQHTKLDWNDEFNRLTRHSGGFVHPAFYLNGMLDTLYLSKSDLAWRDFLADKLPLLSEFLEKSRSDLRGKLSSSEQRAWGLMNIIMGRTYVRLSSGGSDFDALAKALQHFDEVKYERYITAANNGKGTIYVNAFSAYLPSRTSNQLQPQQIDTLRSICPDSYQCAMQALRAYDITGSESSKCSFEIKRRMNNTIDLLTRIGMRYDDVIKGRTNPPIENWIENREVLADEIERRIHDLMSCNSQQPIPATFVTVAQGFGTSAKLRIEAGKDATRQKKAAGTYLKLANSFEPQDLSDWELSYFCFAVNNNEIDSVFKESFADSLPGMSRAEKLLRRIQQRCK